MTPWADWHTTPKQELENKTGTTPRVRTDEALNAIAVGPAINVEYDLPLRPPMQAASVIQMAEARELADEYLQA